MKRDNINYFMVGSFVISMLSIFLVVLFILTGSTGPSDTYYSEYDNIAGIKTGTVVTYEGYQIGQIENIVPLHKNGKTSYNASLSIKKNWKIPADSVARIVASGLLSEVVIDIAEGSSKDYLKPGSSIAGQSGGNIFSALSTIASDINRLTSDSVIPLIEKLKGYIDSGVPEVMDDMKSLLKSLNSSATVIQDILRPENKGKLENIISNTDTTFQNFNELSSHLNETKSEIDRLLSNSNRLVDEARPDVRQAAADLRDTLQIISNNISNIVHNMDATSRNMYEFSRQVRQNPGILLKGKAPSDKGVE